MLSTLADEAIPGPARTPADTSMQAPSRPRAESAVLSEGSRLRGSASAGQAPKSKETQSAAQAAAINALKVGCYSAIARCMTVERCLHCHWRKGWLLDCQCFGRPLAIFSCSYPCTLYLRYSIHHHSPAEPGKIIMEIWKRRE